jgi:hypothetical protein
MSFEGPSYLPPNTHCDSQGARSPFVADMGVVLIFRPLPERNVHHNGPG